MYISRLYIYFPETQNLENLILNGSTYEKSVRSFMSNKPISFPAALSLQASVCLFLPLITLMTLITPTTLIIL